MGILRCGVGRVIGVGRGVVLDNPKPRLPVV
jgi:hypothetical protein